MERISVSKNKNADLVAEIIKQLKENDGYCPCKVKHIPENKCRCKEFRDQVANGIEGECHCGLWVARKPFQIPHSKAEEELNLENNL